MFCPSPSPSPFGDPSSPDQATSSVTSTGRTATATNRPRRFGPPAGFHCGALHVEVTAEGCDLVWGNGSRVPYPGVTLARAVRLVARGTWVELPAARPPRRPRFA